MSGSTELKVELKYCERCGGLWLRQEGDREVYCVECAPEMREMARRTKKRATRDELSRAAAVLGGALCG